MPKKSKGGTNHFGVELADQQLTGKGIPTLVQSLCEHILSERVVQHNGLFAEQANSTELEDAKQLIIEQGVGEADLSDLSPAACTGTLAEYFKELPEPVIPTSMYNSFLEALKHQSEPLQLSECKTLVKQMPEPNRATMIYMLRFLSDVAHYDAFNQTSTRSLAQVFSQPLMRRQSAEFPLLKEAQDKVKVLKLMIEAHSEIAEACAPPPTTGVRSRAARAGIVPGTPLVVDPTPSPDPKFSRALSTSSPQPATAYQEMVHALPPVFDEGMAAVKQLAASNEALTLLLGRVDAELAGLRAENARNAKEVMELRERMEEQDNRHTTSLQDMEDRVSASPKKGQANTAEVSALSHKVEGWMTKVQSRLDELEASKGEEEEKAAPSRGELERFIKTAVDDAKSRSDAQRDEKQVEWQAGMEEDFKLWQEELAAEAGKALGVRIKAAEGAVKELVGRVESLEAAAATGVASPESPAKVQGGGGVDAGVIKAMQEEAAVNEERVNERLDDLMRSVDEVIDRCSKVEGDVEVQLERVNAVQKTVESVSKRQDQHVAEPVEVGEMRARIEALESRGSGGGGGEGATGPVVAMIEKTQGDVLSLQGKVKAMEGDIAGGGSTTKELAATIAKLEEELAHLKQQVASPAARSPSKAPGGTGEGGAELGTELDALQEWVGALEGRLTEHEKACGMPSSASSSPAKSKSGGVDEAFARMFEEVVNPEIVTLRESVHALATSVGRATNADLFEEEEDSNSGAGALTGSVFEQLAALRGGLRAVEGQESAVESISRTLEAVCEEVAELKGRVLLALSTGKEGGGAGADADERIDRLEEDVASLTGFRDQSAAEASAMRKELKAEITRAAGAVDERVDDLSSRVETLSGNAEAANGAGSGAVGEMQTEVEGLKRAVREVRGLVEEAKASAKSSGDRVVQLEGKMVRELEEAESTVDTLAQQVDKLARRAEAEAAKGADGGVGGEALARVVSKLTDQIKRLEAQVSTVGDEQIAVAEKQRDASAGLRRIQASLEQLDVHRGAVYAPDTSVLQVQQDLRRLERELEVLRIGSAAGDFMNSSKGVDGVEGGGGGGSLSRMRESINVMRGEMDGGFIKLENAVDAQGRVCARSEAMVRSLEALVKQTREELVSEVEGERAKVVEAEAKAKRMGERTKKQVEDALEEIRRVQEDLEGSAEGVSRTCRRLEGMVSPLNGRIEVLEAMSRGAQHPSPSRPLSISSPPPPRGGAAAMGGGTTAEEVEGLRDAVASLDKRVSGLASAISDLETGRIAAAEEGLRICRKDVQRAVDEAVEIRASVDRLGAAVAVAEGGEGTEDRRQSRGGGRWAAASGAQNLQRPVDDSADDSADQESAEIVRGTRFRSTSRNRLSGEGGRGGERGVSPKGLGGGRRRRSESPAMRRGMATSDTDDAQDELPRRPSSALRGGGSRGGTPSRRGGPLRASYGGPGGGHGGAGGGAGVAPRGLDRAVERELSQLKRMFGL